MVAEQELRFGSKPSPVKRQSSKKGRGSSHKRLSLGGAMSKSPEPDGLQQNKLSHSAKKMKDRQFCSPGKHHISPELVYWYITIAEPSNASTGKILFLFHFLLSYFLPKLGSSDFLGFRRYCTLVPLLTLLLLLFLVVKFIHQ